MTSDARELTDAEWQEAFRNYYLAMREMMRPITAEEADRIMAEIEPEPMSEQEIDSLVRYAINGPPAPQDDCSAYDWPEV